MTIFARVALAALPLFVSAAAAHAAPYALPSGPAIAQAKLSGPLPSFAVVCDSRVSSACDVAPGDYQLQVFDLAWSATRSTVSVTGGDGAPVTGKPAAPLPLFIVRDEQRAATFLTASCSGTARAIGGSCAAIVDGVAVPLSVNTTLLREVGASRTLPGRHSCATSVRATIAAEVICLAD